MSTTLYSDPHFIKPLFPGFEDELLIPADFMNHLKGEKGGIAMLRSRREGKLWPIKINGGQFRDGWKQFVHDHDLQLGDCLLFRHEGNLAFYVLVFGHNTCEREYPPFIAKEEPLEIQEQNLPDSSSDPPFTALQDGPTEIIEHNRARGFRSVRPRITATVGESIEDQGQNLPNCPIGDHSPFAATEEEPIELQEQNLPNCSVNGSKLKRNLKGKTKLGAKASSFPNCVAKVTPDGIKSNRLHIPWKFVEDCGLNPQTYSIILKDENSDYWRAVLSYSSLAKRCYIGSGWASYQRDHNLKAGDSLMIELVKNGETPVFKVTRHKMVSRRNTRKSGAL